MATLPPGPREDEGIWRTDFTTGERELLLSTARLAEASSRQDVYGRGARYVFSCRFSPDRRRIGIVLRRAVVDVSGNIHRNPSLLTYDMAADRLYEAVPTATGARVSWIRTRPGTATTLSFASTVRRRGIGRY